MNPYKTSPDVPQYKVSSTQCRCKIDDAYRLLSWIDAGVLSEQWDERLINLEEWSISAWKSRNDQIAAMIENNVQRELDEIYSAAWDFAVVLRMDLPADIRKSLTAARIRRESELLKIHQGFCLIQAEGQEHRIEYLNQAEKLLSEAESACDLYAQDLLLEEARFLINLPVADSNCVSEDESGESWKKGAA